MIWLAIALAWFVGFGISMRRRLTKALDKSYQEALDCKRCSIYRRSPQLTENTCAIHESELYPGDVFGAVIRSVIWPVTTTFWLIKQGFTRTFFSRSGKLHSKARDRWLQEIRSARAARELAEAEKSLKEIEAGKQPAIALTEPTAAEIRDALDEDRHIRRLRDIRSRY